MPCAVSSLSPILRTVSIIPGMENLAPERQETNSGFSLSPKVLPVAFSIVIRACSTWSHIPSGNTLPAARYALHASVVTIKPGGTGTPRRCMSARLAPLPPNSPRNASQSLPTSAMAISSSSKRYTHFFIFIITSHLDNNPKQAFRKLCGGEYRKMNIHSQRFLGWACQVNHSVAALRSRP